MVNEKEIVMGTLDFNYNESKKNFTSIDNERQAVWTFNVKDGTIEGSLVFNGTIYRIILQHKET